MYIANSVHLPNLIRVNVLYFFFDNNKLKSNEKNIDPRNL